MPIAWNAIKPLIRKQVSDLTGVSSQLVRWVDEPSGDLFGAEPVIYLRIQSIDSLGYDEERSDAPPNVSPLDPRFVYLQGQRKFTLSVRCESFTSDIADDLHPQNVIDRLKIRFWRTSSVTERFGVFDIATYLTTKWFSYIDAGGKPIQTAVADFICVTANVDTDDSADAGDWIGEVEVNSTPLNDVDGNPTPQQIVLDVKAD